MPRLTRLAPPGRSIGWALADLVLPDGCVACPASGPALCRSCQQALFATPRLASPDPPPHGLPLTWSLTSYDGVARAAILAHKERGRLALASALGDALAVAIGSGLPADHGGARRPLAVVPIPSRPGAVRARGHDPMLRIARRAVAVLRSEGHHLVVTPVLRPTRRVADQSGLSSAQRSANLRGAFAVPARFTPLVDGFATIIVDDVVTTGASLAEAARAVGAAGGDVIAAAVIAATARWSSPAITNPTQPDGV